MSVIVVPRYSVLRGISELSIDIFGRLPAVPFLDASEAGPLKRTYVCLMDSRVQTGHHHLDLRHLLRCHLLLSRTYHHPTRLPSREEVHTKNVVKERQRQRNEVANL